MATRGTRQSGIVELLCIAGGRAQEIRDAREAMGAWGAVGEALWPAWSRMSGSEMCVYDALGEQVGEKLLVLWAISRFRESDMAGIALAELVDKSGRPRFGDPLVEDMMLAAFALGAAWASEVGGSEGTKSIAPDALLPPVRSQPS
jgi:hypothetical protein